MIRLPCLFALALTATTLPAKADSIRIGVLAFQGSERAAKDFEPTIAHLARTLPEHSFTLIPLDLAGMERAARAGSLGFVITNPGNYIELESSFGITRLATLETRNHAIPTDTVGSTIIVANRPRHPAQLSGLAGARLAVVDKDAFGGWHVIQREMEAHGLPARRLTTILETGFPMTNVITALRNGRADAGILRTCLLEEEIAAGRVAPDEFAVVGERPEPGFPCRLSSRLYPDWPFARLAGTPPDLAKAVTASLLSMAPADGRAWTAPQDYTSVHALFRELKIGPYANLEHSTFIMFLRVHWQWFLIACLGVIWWIIHVARVETLVRRRTAELTREIQEREKAEQTARTHREERDQFSRLGILGEMASNIAHEINQPLAAITNYAEGMTRLIDAGRTGPALLRDGVRGIAGQAERAGLIIRRIRSFVRRREFRREHLDVNEVLRETLPLFEGTASRLGVPLHVHPDPDLPQVYADRIQIEQVLFNLLQNALDAMTETDGRERGIEVTARLAGEAVEIKVRDHGSGLTVEAEAHLFDAFFTTKPNGLGLGLSICRTIIENHSGRLWAGNEAGGGLSMHFTLPVARETDE